MNDKRPVWLTKRLIVDERVTTLERDLAGLRLNTVCQEACCPNQGECFSHGVATFLIMGNICTRNCRFCAVKSGTPSAPDPQEPQRLAQEVERLGLRFVVITSVTRDDLDDGGAGHFVSVISALRERCPGVGIEVLIPDFGGSESALVKVAGARPEILNHNVETIPRLYSSVRPQAEYRRSLQVLSQAGRMGLLTKSGLMVGLGETLEEVKEVMLDLLNAGCRLLTIGQYLMPSKLHHKVVEYVSPEIFDQYKDLALSMGFSAVASSPFVRSSYMADEFYSLLMAGKRSH
ncbi:MAG: lipoyl synthase [Desulfobacteraceae bacterium]|jgi:lipoic acid synthetase|nr:MAG: lipoyl synthase [Desulfobacteraceae bacterium]